jgi:hypothetical protein
MKRLAIVGLMVVATLGSADARTRVVKLKMGPFNIEAKRDREVCQVLRIPNVPQGTELVSWEARSKLRRKGLVGSHHLVAYGYTGGDAQHFPGGIVDSAGCVDIGPADFFTRRVFLAGSGGEFAQGSWSVTKGAMPGNLAQVLPVDAGGNAVVVLNSHYFNSSPKTAKGLIRIALRLAPLPAGKKLVRQMIHLDASRDIMVPPGGTGSVTSTFQADGAPNYATEGGVNPSGDICVFVLSTHMHKRGMRFTVSYEDADGARELLSWPDYLHPGTVLLPSFRRDEDAPGLLRAYTADNKLPRIRYQCDYANGVEGKPVKTGCEETPGTVPGIPWSAAEPLGIPFNESHAKPCGQDAVNCGGKACVDANLVYGPLSDDDMCVLTAIVFDPTPGATPDRACSVY